MAQAESAADQAAFEFCETHGSRFVTYLRDHTSKCTCDPKFAPNEVCRRTTIDLNTVLECLRCYVPIAQKVRQRPQRSLPPPGSRAQLAGEPCHRPATAPPLRAVCA